MKVTTVVLCTLFCTLFATHSVYANGTAEKEKAVNENVVNSMATLYLPVITHQAAEVVAQTIEEPSGPDFRVIDRRLWDIFENEGYHYANSFSCGPKHIIQVHVIDQNGNRLNNVAVHDAGSGQTFHTGEQGWDEGVVEFHLSMHSEVVIAHDDAAHSITSETATGLTTQPQRIPVQSLIDGFYCTDKADCDEFVRANTCAGSFSWNVVFQRNS